MQTTTTTKPSKQRDYLFDNYKALLILLVVIGHFMEPCADNTPFLHTMKWLIFSFHMPAFIFISGYFSKKELALRDIVCKLALPYLSCEVIYYLFYTFVTHKDTEMYLLYPKFSLWYLFALFVWRAVTPMVKKIPCYLPITILLGLAIGCSDMAGNYLSLPRILYFYPFFLAGMHFDRELLTKFRTRTTKLVSVAGILALTAFFALSPICKSLSVKVFYGRYSYEILKQSVVEGVITRMLCYMIGFLMTFAVMTLVSEKKTFYSYIGMRTMAIYLFHGLAYSYLKDCTSLLKGVNTTTETIVLLMSCLLLTVVFATPIFTKITNIITLTFVRIPSRKALQSPKLMGILHAVTHFRWHPDSRSFRIFAFGGRV